MRNKLKREKGPYDDLFSDEFELSIREFYELHHDYENVDQSLFDSVKFWWRKRKLKKR